MILYKKIISYFGGLLVKITVVLIFFTNLILSTNCQSDKSKWEGIIEQEDGIFFIKNPNKPIFQEQPFHYELEISIGESENSDEYLFQEIGVVNIDHEDRIFISDWKESLIKIFDKDGNYLKTIGGKGHGPGEFERINTIQFIKENKFAVFDGNMRRLTIFTGNGEYERSILLNKINTMKLSIDSRNNIIASTINMEISTNLATTELQIFDGDQNIIKTIETTEPASIFNPFLPFSQWILKNNDQIIYGYNKKYEFHIYDPSWNLITIISKDYSPIEITQKDKAAMLKQLSNSVKISVPKYFPAYRRITVAEDSWLIVQTWEKSKDEKQFYYDFFDDEGRYICKNQIISRPIIWKKNSFYTIEEDDKGFQCVNRYKVTWRIKGDIVKCCGLSVPFGISLIFLKSCFLLKKQGSQKPYKRRSLSYP